MLVVAVLKRRALKSSVVAVGKLTSVGVRGRAKGHPAPEIREPVGRRSLPKPHREMLVANERRLSEFPNSVFSG
jgi:hypothetical protein